ncbi:MAG: hypothetical protein ACK5H0_09030 [Bacteroidota bacterium]
MDIIYVIFGGAIGSALRYLVGLLPTRPSRLKQRLCWNVMHPP